MQPSEQPSSRPSIAPSTQPDSEREKVLESYQESHPSNYIDLFDCKKFGQQPFSLGLLNQTQIGEVMRDFKRDLDRMWSKRAFTHWFCGEMSDEEIQYAIDIVSDLIEEYAAVSAPRVTPSAEEQKTD